MHACMYLSVCVCQCVCYVYEKLPTTSLYMCQHLRGQWHQWPLTREKIQLSVSVRVVCVCVCVCECACAFVVARFQPYVCVYIYIYAYINCICEYMFWSKQICIFGTTPHGPWCCLKLLVLTLRVALSMLGEHALGLAWPLVILLASGPGL